MVETQQISGLLARLEATPGRFAVALSRLQAADTVTEMREGGWSPEEVLAHVRASHDIMVPRITAILVRDNPPLPAYDDRRWAEVMRYPLLTMSDSLEGLRIRNRELVAALRHLPLGEWQRTGNHETQGELTLLDVVTKLVEHDEEHAAQLEQSASLYVQPE